VLARSLLLPHRPVFPCLRRTTHGKCWGSACSWYLRCRNMRNNGRHCDASFILFAYPAIKGFFGSPSVHHPVSLLSIPWRSVQGLAASAAYLYSAHLCSLRIPPFALGGLCVSARSTPSIARPTPGFIVLAHQFTSPYCTRAHTIAPLPPPPSPAVGVLFGFGAWIRLPIMGEPTVPRERVFHLLGSLGHLPIFCHFICILSPTSCGATRCASVGAAVWPVRSVVPPHLGWRHTQPSMYSGLFGCITAETFGVQRPAMLRRQ
jgi:hypothetical protein